MGNNGVNIIIAVPRSGCWSIITVGARPSKSGIIIDEKFFIFKLWSDRYLARAIMVKIFANSLGCTENGSPKSSHRNVPACGDPKNGSIIIIIPKMYKL